MSWLCKRLIEVLSSFSMTLWIGLRCTSAVICLWNHLARKILAWFLRSPNQSARIREKFVSFEYASCNKYNAKICTAFNRKEVWQYQVLDGCVWSNWQWKIFSPLYARIMTLFLSIIRTVLRASCQTVLPRTHLFSRHSSSIQDVYIYHSSVVTSFTFSVCLFC